MANPTTIAISDDFVFGEVSPLPTQLSPVVIPSLGPLAAFTGTFSGNGFNTIFRPDNPVTPTPLPIPVNSDNILELNLTSETLAFSPALGGVPNRGEVQGDIFLNGVPYLQTIQDITNPAHPVGIHVEPGIWMVVPSTNRPAEPQSLVRMGSIPHGTTINAQGTSKSFVGPPTIPPVSITPLTIPLPHSPVPFPSQTATAVGTPRIPQDLTSFIASGSITQQILDDPNTVLRNHIATQTIVATTQIDVSTIPDAPLFGGGTDNIAFLLGDPTATQPNADSVKMKATFWIETVELKIIIPIFRPGQPPLLVRGTGQIPGQPVPKFMITPTVEIQDPRVITIRFTQIQYSQLVLLNFNGLTWPHVSVATLVPGSPIHIQPGGWE